MMQQTFIVSRFNKAAELIQSYKGVIPLSHYLKKYYSANKKHGSKDRKFITQLCYCFFRLGNSLQNIDVEQKLKLSIFFCNNGPADWAVLLDENWRGSYTGLLKDKIDFIKTIYHDFDSSKIFFWMDEISENIDHLEFSQSHLQQPDLFLKIRPGKKQTVLAKFIGQEIPYLLESENCLRLTNTTKIDTLLQLNKEAVIQDYSSQRVVEFLQIVKSNINHQLSVWDCCAASGGKSILAYDELENIELTVSDIRPSILDNLRQRFKEAGIKKYQTHIVDLTKENLKPLTLGGGKGFSLIICDAPCTGSGTWGRTPEQLCFFAKNSIDEYVILQQKILCNTIPQLKGGGYFLYITCSVFKKENEMAVAYIQRNFCLQLVKMEVLKGYTIKADTMFAALFFLP